MNEPHLKIIVPQKDSMPTDSGPVRLPCLKH
jgi:hypothetical protein